MIICNEGNSLEIVATEWLPGDLPSPHDVRLRVTVVSHGFGGCGSVWIGAERIQAFIRQLHELDVHRQGAAALEAISPSEFVLQIGAINRRGSMAISGRLAQQRYGGEAGPYMHVVEFGFGFDSTNLQVIVSEFEAIAATH